MSIRSRLALLNIDKAIQYVDSVKSSVSSAVDFVSQIPSTVASTASSIWNNIAGTVAGYTNSVVQTGQNIYNGAISAVGSASSWLNEKINYLKKLI